MCDIYLPHQTTTTMTITTNNSGQIEVKFNNLVLIQTKVSGVKFNECVIIHSDYVESVSVHSEEFKPLFVALHNYKCGY
jgi:hypothetical protein